MHLLFAAGSGSSSPPGSVSVRPESVKSLVHCERGPKLRFVLRWAAILIAVAPCALGQLADQERAETPSADSTKYQIRATLTDYCPVERLLNLHQVIFDFHNASCQDRKHVVELKTPTLPNGPLYRNVRIAGYHFIDWAEGHSSPSARNAANVELSKTTTTLSASGWLGKASCSKSAAGDTVVEDAFWQARVVPEVQFLEDMEHQEPPVTGDIVPPKTTAVLALSASCADEHEETLQYSVTSLVNGVAQPSIYTSPVLKGSKTGMESEATLGAVSIHSRWSPVSLQGKTELSVTIVPLGGQSGGENKESPQVAAP